MLGSDGISVADALALSGGNRNSGSGSGGFGEGNGWWVIILILFFAVGGWGRGFGGGGNGGGNDGGSFYGYVPYFAPATSQGVTDAFNFNQLDNGIRSIQNGICDGFYAMNTSINSVAAALQNCCCQTQQAIANASYDTQSAINNLGFQVQQGFCGVDKSILQNGYQTQTGLTALSNQLASCCCDIARGQDATKYEIAQVANNLLVASDKNTDRIINYLTQTEMDRLRTDLQSAQAQIARFSQTNEIISQLMPVAKPAYITCSPYAAAFGTYSVNTNCGCGCGCA